MDNFFDKLMESIFIESKFSLVRSEYLDGPYDLSTNVYIAHKPQSDYFIYLNLPERLLPYVTNDIQIKLFSIIKSGSKKFDTINGKEVNISSSFEKNATLIIIVNQEGGVSNDITKQAISIEEDAYFFKKQVLVISSKDLAIISDSFYGSNGSYISSLQTLISDTAAFNEFMNSKPLALSNKATEYSFVAKLYEKIPFLALSVEKSNPGDLQEKIDNKLSIEQQEQCNALLKLNVDDLNHWFAEILKEESDA